MGNLMATLLSSAEGVRVYQRALNVVQNNVINASTPGWVKQSQPLQARRFDPARGIIGGVTTGELVSARGEFLEQSVRTQQEYSGFAGQKAQDLALLEPVFPIAENSGIAGNLDAFFNSAAHWSVNPNDMASRQVVLDRAATLAQSFNQTADTLGQVSQQADRQIRSTIDGINRLAAKLTDLNIERRRDFNTSTDPGLEAQVYSTLEELSELIDYTVLPQIDGTVTVLVGGQIPLVMGDHQFTLDGNFSSTLTGVVDDQGNDITATVSRGQLAALLDTRNNVVPSLMGELDTMAFSVADQVNGVLAGGLDANGQPPALDLFAYDPAHPAATLTATALAASQLAGAIPSVPGGNENALNLAELGNSPQVNGLTYSQYYGDLAARVGRLRTDAQDAETLRSEFLSQARTLREDTTGVSLDEEAIHLMELERGYQAIAKLLVTLDELTGVVLDLLK